MLYYVILVILGISISVPIIRLFLRSGNTLFIIGGMLWGFLSILPLVVFHELAVVPVWLRLVAFPAWVIPNILHFIIIEPYYSGSSDLLSSSRLLKDISIDVVVPVLSVVGPPLLGGFIVWIFFVLRQRIIANDK